MGFFSKSQGNRSLEFFHQTVPCIVGCFRITACELKQQTPLSLRLEGIVKDSEALALPGLFSLRKMTRDKEKESPTCLNPGSSCSVSSHFSSRILPKIK